MSQYEGTLIDKISFLTAEQQEKVLKFVEDVEVKEPSNNLQIIVRFELYWIEIIAKHPERYDLWHSSFGGGVEFIDILASYLKETHHLLPAKISVERVIHDIGSIIPITPERMYMLKGRNLDTGLPSSLEISSIEIRDQISSDIQFKIKNVAGNIRLLPRNMGLAEHVLDSATIRIRGRYGRLPGLAEAVQQATGLEVIDW